MSNLQLSKNVVNICVNHNKETWTSSSKAYPYLILNLYTVANFASCLLNLYVISQWYTRLGPQLHKPCAGLIIFDNNCFIYWPEMTWDDIIVWINTLCLIFHVNLLVFMKCHIVKYNLPTLYLTLLLCLYQLQTAEAAMNQPSKHVNHAMKCIFSQ